MTILIVALIVILAAVAYLLYRAANRELRGLNPEEWE